MQAPVLEDGILSDSANQPNLVQLEPVSASKDKKKSKPKLKSRSKSKPPVITLNLGEETPENNKNPPTNALKPAFDRCNQVRTTTAKGTKVIEFTIERAPDAPSKPRAKKNHRVYMSEVDLNCRSENEEPFIRLEPDSGAFDEFPLSNTNGTKPFKSRQ